MARARERVDNWGWGYVKSQRRGLNGRYDNSQWIAVVTIKAACLRGLRDFFAGGGIRLHEYYALAFTLPNPGGFRRDEVPKKGRRPG